MKAELLITLNNLYKLIQINQRVKTYLIEMEIVPNSDQIKLCRCI